MFCSFSQMVELEMDNELKEVREVDVLLASEMIERHSGSSGTLCFAVRRPGTCWLRFVPPRVPSPLARSRTHAIVETTHTVHGSIELTIDFIPTINKPG